MIDQTPPANLASQIQACSYWQQILAFGIADHSVLSKPAITDGNATVLFEVLP